MKKIVLYVSGFYFGGIEAFVTNIAENLDYNKFELILLTRYADVNSEAFKKVNKLNIKIVSLNIKHLTVKSIIEFRRKLQSFFKKEDVDFIHINSLDEPLICNIAKKNDITIGIHAHEPFREYIGGINQKIKDLVRLNNIKKSDYYLTCSEQTGNEVYAKYNIDIFNVIPNGINVVEFMYNENIRSDYRKKYDEDKILLGNIGRFSEVKNHNWMIKVFNEIYKKNNNYRLILVGTGETLNEAITLVKEYKLEEVVSFLGERIDVSSLLQMMDIFIMPSKFEGLGISLIEAQASGLQCIVSDAIPDEAIVTDLVKKKSLNDSVNEWCDVILGTSIDYDRKKYNKVVQNTIFDAKYMCKQLEDIYGK